MIQQWLSLRMSGEADRPRHARYNDESGIYDFFYKTADKQQLTSKASALMQTKSHIQVKKTGSTVYFCSISLFFLQDFT